MKKILYPVVLSMLAATLFLANARTASNKTEISQQLQIFNQLGKNLQLYYVDSINAEKTMRAAIDAMLETIDPYTVYYTADEAESFNSISSGEFSGIGSYVTKRDGHVELSQPQRNAPAYKAGVRHGDIIIAIDGDTVGADFTTSDATKRLRGQVGTTVRLTVKRPYVTDSILDFEITRGTIKSNAVPYYGFIDDGIGYISLESFSETSADEVKNALLELKKNPSMRALVLDLRDNGGGLLESAVQIAGYFVPKGTKVVTTKYKDKSAEKTFKTTHQPIDAKIPIAVLINDNTASASELVSGALQDLDRAVVAGRRSFGKGLVQQTLPMPYDGMMKVTVGRYYIPSGRLVQAIDYSHRNPDGSVARIPDSLTTVFHTKAGREVRDGGGITPDMKITPAEYSRLVYTVANDMWAYDFANKYVAEHPEPGASAADFTITDSIFNQFVDFIDPAKFAYDKPFEKTFEALREVAQQEGYLDDDVKAEFDKLETMLKHDLRRDLEYNKPQLVMLLDQELSQRYFDQSDCEMRRLKYDNDIKKVIEMFNTPGRYEEMLAPVKNNK